ncbi:MAG: carboxypeptidase-like regulatory domain-containing protein, partial [Cyclobacteriaceae bacterium]
MKLNYHILKPLLLFIIAISYTNYGYAQVKTIAGKVSASEDGSAIPGVNILVKNTTTGAVTDVNGNYALSVDENDILVFSSIGYSTQEVAVAGRSVINLTLEADVKSLQEIVVVGYGSQLKKEITGAVQTVTSKDLKDIPVSQINQKLQGRLAGVQINQTTGKPGQGMTV